MRRRRDEREDEERRGINRWSDGMETLDALGVCGECARGAGTDAAIGMRPPSRAEP